MTSDTDTKEATPSPAMIVRLLSAVEAGSTNQRGFASEIGVAVGLANALIKRCVRKGLIKIVAAPARRYAYYLTPTGLSEKSRLVAEYVSESLRFFGMARGEFVGIWRECEQRGLNRVVLWGAGELAEIAVVASDGLDIAIVGVVDAGVAATAFQGIPVSQRLTDCAPFDAVVLTSSADLHRTYEEMCIAAGERPCLAPAFLYVGSAQARHSPSTTRTLTQ